MNQEIINILNKRHKQSLNREFIEFVKNIEDPSAIVIDGKKVINFCSNDYLRLSVNKNVMQAMHNGINLYGVGSGGTRNISGTTQAHTELEVTIALLHKKPSSLLFSSAYNANVGALSAIGKNISNIAFFSDAENHASIIHGINLSKAQKFVYKHNNLLHLEELLQTHTQYKAVIVCESIYSMSGTKTDLNKISQLAQKYNATTYVDEVHAVGLYGNSSGIANQQNAEIDIINGTFGKAFGCIGGYIASSTKMCEVIKAFATTFIFSTSLPPSICLACNVAIKESQSLELQKQFWDKVTLLKKYLQKYNIPIIQTDSHIISISVPSSNKVKYVSKTLLDTYSIYVQPIFYPTVPIGKEILRITVSPFHTEESLAYFASSIHTILEGI